MSHSLQDEKLNREREGVSLTIRFHFRRSFDEPAEFLFRQRVMSACLRIRRIEFLEIHRESLEVDNTVKIFPLTPKLVLMKSHSF